jgi:hypothetical protein
MTMNWYCVHTKPLKEQQIATHFYKMLGLEMYFPRLRRPLVEETGTTPVFASRVKSVSLPRGNNQCAGLLQVIHGAVW